MIVKKILIGLLFFSSLYAIDVSLDSIPSEVQKNSRTSTNIDIVGDVQDLTKINIKSSESSFTIDVTNVDIPNKKVYFDLVSPDVDSLETTLTATLSSGGGGRHL